MSKKNYVLIAKTIKELNFTPAMQDIVTSAFCKTLNAENHSFNEQKFRDYIQKGE